MEIEFKHQSFLKSLGHIQGVIEKKSTLPILSNVLIEAQASKVKITSTDLDLIFIEEITDANVIKEGATTTSASILFDIIRKLPGQSSIKLKLISEEKIQIQSGNSKFNLLCLSANDFPLSQEDFDNNTFELNSKDLEKVINKTKIAVSNDETRHYLSGIYFHKTSLEKSFFLTATATDSHRLSISNIPLKNDINFESIILPKKTIFQLSNLLDGMDEKIKITNNKSKIKFLFKNSILISKVIDGKFPNYNQVIPKGNKKILEINLKDFITSIDRVISVSPDRKEGLKMQLLKNAIKLSVNSPNGGEGQEMLNASYNFEEIIISFNSKYLTDIASQIEGKNIVLELNDSTSPAIIKDPSDSSSLHVVMPMKI